MKEYIKARIRRLESKHLLYMAWASAWIAMLGSLYFSEILGFQPCVLCWYQRILMYPMVLIIGVGIWKKDRLLPFYVLPLSIAGIGVALYHYLLQMGVIPERVGPCSLGASCTSIFFNYLHFINIPFLSLLSFVIITSALLVYRRLI